MGKHVVTRTLWMRTGSEGPRHDPYSFTEISVITNGKEVMLHMGLATYIEVSGKQLEPPKRARHSTTWLCEKFKKLTGVEPAKFSRYYDRVHPYFEDPMGHPSQYE